MVTYLIPHIMAIVSIRYFYRAHNFSFKPLLFLLILYYQYRIKNKQNLKKFHRLYASLNFFVNSFCFLAVRGSVTGNFIKRAKTMKRNREKYIVSSNTII